MFRSRILGALAVLAISAFLISSCDSISGGSSSSGNSIGKALKGTWIGYGKTVSKETNNSSSARLDGFKINSSGKITEYIDSGAWVAFTTPLTLSKTATSNIYTSPGADFPNAEPDATLILVLSSDGAHIVVFQLDQTQGSVDMATYNLDNTATDTVPADPTTAIPNTSLAKTWSGTAFDVTVNSPPAVNVVDSAASMQFTTSGSNLPVATGQTFLGHTLNDDGPATLLAYTSGTDPNYGVFYSVYSNSTYFYWVIPSPDLGVIGFVYCSPFNLTTPSNTSYCGDGSGTYAISLMPASGGANGWGFALLSAQ